MFKKLQEWLHSKKWVEIDPNLARDYMVTFSTPEGQRVMRHLFDNIYCQVYAGNNHNDVVTFNARRTVIHEILVCIDIGEHPERYIIKTTEQHLEEMLGDGRRDPE